MTFAHTLRIQPDFRTAADRACDNQKNNCAEIANSPTGTFEVSDCDKQNGGFYAGNPTWRAGSQFTLTCRAIHRTMQVVDKLRIEDNLWGASPRQLECAVRFHL